MSAIWTARIIARRVYNKIPRSIRRRTTPILASAISKLAEYKETSLFLGERRLRTARLSIRQGKLQEAFEFLEREVTSDDQDLRLLELYAETAFQLAKTDVYREISEQILRIDPLNVKALKRLISGGQYYELDAELLEDFLSKHGNESTFLRAAEFYLNMGNIPRCIDACERGLRSIKSANRRNTNLEEIESKTYLIKGHALTLNYQWQEAEETLGLVKLGTSSYGKAAFLRARALLEQDNPEAALLLMEHQFSKAGKKVNFQVTYFASLLRLNRIEDAFRLYRLRPQSKMVAKLFSQKLLPNHLNILDERNKSKKSLFLSEFGPGDEIRFSSIYSDFVSLFSEIHITCDPRLYTIMKRTFPRLNFLPVERYRREVAGTSHADRLAVWEPRLRNFVSDGVLQEAKDKDVVCTILDTLGELRRDRSDFRRQRTRYAVDADLDAHWKRHLKGRANLQVGLAWRSLLSSPDRDRHYIKVEDLSHLSRVKGVDFWILQAGVTDEELQYLSARLNIIVPDVDLKDDFEGQAALLANLDVTISPLTTMAELAGMVDCRTLIFCRTPEAIWRRNDDGTDVWYDNARLVAGEPIHDTEALMKSLVEELQGIQQALCPANS